MERRSFFQSAIKAAMASAGVGLLSEFDIFSNSNDKFAVDEMSDTEFWHWVRHQYSVSPNITNLNNGGVCPMPTAVQDAQNDYIRLCNEAPSYYMWRILDAGREALRANLAAMAGVEADEIAINRNATEGLNSIIFGLNLKKGDEIVLNKYDYPNMINAWKQREKRDGIKLVWIEEMNFPEENEQKLVEKYVEKFSSKTKVVHISQVINWTGQVLPVKKIAAEARKRNIEILVDGAHSFAQMDFTIKELDCDYFATSLHKWLCAPFGSGLMYIRKEKIKDVWALLSANEPDGMDIRKFESLGTRSFAAEMSIGHALDFHHLIGTKRKEQRLQQLKNYWTSQLQDLENVGFHSSSHPDFGCAIGHVFVKGKDGPALENFLFEKYKIHTVAIQWEKLNGVRITPNVYTLERDLDKLADGIRKFAKI
jgi:selenocysteine lyase/cysteine desulfurase